MSYKVVSPIRNLPNTPAAFHTLEPADPRASNSLRVLPRHRMEVEFTAGLRGVEDMPRNRYNGMFAPQADEAYFRLASIGADVVV